MAEAKPPDAGAETETVASADGTPIAFERTGSGPPVVLVHGCARDHRFWDLSDVRSALAEHCTVSAMDCRGVGESGDAAEYEREREFEDVAAVVDHELYSTVRRREPGFLRGVTRPIADALPKARIASFDGCGHEAMLTAPDRFREEVLAFVRT